MIPVGSLRWLRGSTIVLDESETERPKGARNLGFRRATHNVRGVQRKGLVVYLTDEEHALLQARAEAMRTSKSRLLRDAAFAPTGGAIESTQIDLALLAHELRDYRRKVEGAVTNLNQIARHANTTHEVPADFPQTVEHLNAVADQLDEIVRQVTR